MRGIRTAEIFEQKEMLAISVAAARGDCSFERKAPWHFVLKNNVTGVVKDYWPNTSKSMVRGSKNVYQYNHPRQLFKDAINFCLANISNKKDGHTN